MNKNTAPETKEDIVASSQIGFKIHEKYAGPWRYGEKLCLLCGRPAYPTAYYPPNLRDKGDILVIPLCQYHKASYHSHGLKRLDAMYRKEKEEKL